MTGYRGIAKGARHALAKWDDEANLICTFRLETRLNASFPRSSHWGRVARRASSLTLAAAASACTPLGMWLYEDPTFALAAVQLVGEGSGTTSLEFVMAGCNRNDYDVQAQRLDVQLELNGSRVGKMTQDVPIMLTMRDQTPVPVLLPGWSGSPSPGAEEREVTFKLVGTGVISSPMGQRTVRIVQQGTVRIKDAKPVSWVARDAVPCRPGTSVLPNAPGRGTPITIPTAPPPPPPNQSPYTGGPPGPS